MGYPGLIPHNTHLMLWEVSEMSSEILAANHICKSFGGVQALRDVSLSVSPAEIHCLVGENGSGKSTLVKVISGVHAPDSGEIILNGNKYSKCLSGDRSAKECR